ncbi:MAG: tetratricopeptide repeat protein [Armatimonadota bacterium]|nr:tetratricopeptide repeat protein [Armatimonadota bacterium]
MTRPVGRSVRFWLGAAIAMLTLVCYWQVLGHGFIGLDDGEYVTKNAQVQAGLTTDGVRWALTSFYAGNWHPLTWFSHMLDCQLYGLKPWGHHLTNLLFHILSALLLFLALSRMTGCVWRSAFVAALFAVHPIHVESVAWIAERKDVLSSFFWMLTILAYARYVERPSLGRYATVVLSFTLGLMSKPMLVSLPFVLLLLDYWPLNRLRFDTKNKTNATVVIWPFLKEKVPLFTLAAASCVVTIIAQRSGEAVATFNELSVGVRAANALVAYVSYLIKTFMPTHLAVYYPHPGASIPVWQVVGAALLLVTISVAALFVGRRLRYLTVGWFWYLGTLVPVIGLAQVGGQAMADRYTYIPLIGVFLIAAWLIPDLLHGLMGRNEDKSKSKRTLPRCMICLSAAALGIVFLMMTLTHRQAGYWRDNVRLARHAIQVTNRNAMAHYLLGIGLMEQGRGEEAAQNFRRALKIYPGFAGAYFNLGRHLARTGKTLQAIDCYEKALRISPDYSEAHNNLGNSLAAQGKFDEAIRHYRAAVEIRPDYGLAHCNIAVAMYFKKDYAAAWREVDLSLKYGHRPNREFLKELSKRMPEPRS